MSASFALEVKVPHRASISVQVSADDSVASLAAKVASALGSGTAVSDIRLCFRGHTLQDGATTLSALGVTQAHFVVALPENGMVLSWQSASDGRVPVGAVRAGVEAINGAPLYLARAMIEGGAHPGKCAPHLDSCRAGYGGGEHVSKAYEVLVALDRSKRPWPQYQPLLGAAKSKPTFSALPVAYPSAVDGALPRGALSAGWEADGTRLFAALVADPHGGVCPGKTRPGFDGCNVGFGGRELTLHPHALLCVPAGVAPPSDAGVAPAEPARKLRRYLTSVAELFAWSPTSMSADLEPPPPPSDATASSPIPPLATGRPRALHCHDMMGGYCEAADEGYLSCFGGWSAIDAFIYFSHQRVSLPPRCWIDACHARGMPCLGTLLTEGAIGVRENASLLARADEAAERLAELCASYGFDGWLINIEAPLEPAAVPSFVEFLQLLTICCKQRVGGHALVLYYDSLDAATGQVRYQNALTPANMPFFDACDGIFTNYWWRPGNLTSSAALAGPARMRDVYVGIDCFARGDLMYTAGAGCGSAVRHAREAGLSLALFAPGWSLECGEAREHAARPDKARECDARFWEALGVERLYTAGANASSGASPSTK